ncbi:MAG TPA: VOC family protein [Longimicrobiaceae bacterium]
MFTALFPIIATPDMGRALRFYRDALDGRVIYEFSAPDGTLAYAGLEIGSSHLGIGLNPGEAGGDGRPISLWIYAEDCDAAVERLRVVGTPILQEPRDEPWGERVARVRDPDGNEIVIGQQGRGEQARPSLGASLISPEPERYMRQEYERRFLLAPGASWRELVEPYCKRFDDIYLRRTYLRVRTLTDSATGREFIKLTKKLTTRSPYVQMVGSIPLSPMEYEFIAGLAGDRLIKQRYYHFFGANVFSIDVFEGELEGLVLCEVEAGDLEELMQIELPDYIGKEVTEDSFFTGGQLCRASRSELRRKLDSIRSLRP